MSATTVSTDKKKLEQKSSYVAPINVFLKAKYSFYTTLLFFIAASPETYKLLQRALGRFITIASADGLPTPTGFFFQTFLTIDEFDDRRVR